MKNKVALITGASGEIGESICKVLAQKGYNIIYHYNTHKNEKLLMELSKNVGVLAVQADLKGNNGVEFLVEQTLKTFGRIDVIINNAGYSSPSLFVDETYESISECLSVNLTSAISLTSALIPAIKQGGSIINISSIWGVCGGSMEVVYSASKAGLIGFTKALSKEIGTMGIRVNAIAPGFIDTKMNKHLSCEEKQEFMDSSLCLSRLGTPKDVANVVEFLVSDKASYITGQVIGVDGGFIG